jgi:hypothetical protein
MNAPTGLRASANGTAPAPRPAGFFPAAWQREPAWAISRWHIWVLWLIPLLLLLAALFMGEESAGILWSVLAAATACLIALAAVSYRLTSFVAIVALYHLIVYPLAAWGNLLLPEPTVRADLWLDTARAMQGCAVGMLALALGVWVANCLADPRQIHTGDHTLAAPSAARSNILLALLIIPIALLLVSLGAYYHMVIIEGSTAAQGWSNLISIVQYIAYSGLFLQVYRYTRTNSRTDAFWAGALALLCILVFLPSGSRYSAFGFLPLLLLAFSEWGPDWKKKIVIIGGSILVMLALTSGISSYRSIKGIDRANLEEKYSVALNSTLNPRSDQTDPWAVIIGRMSDYTAAGRIIAFTPDNLDFRGAEALESLWQIFVPGFLNILPDRINLADGAELCDRYWITKSYKGYGSSPCMIIGDLYSRWGWPGIFLGMLVIGFVLRQIDLRIFYRWETFTIIYFVLMGRLILSIGGGSLIQVCVTLFRDSLAMAAIAYLLAYVIKLKKV